MSGNFFFFSFALFVINVHRTSLGFIGSKQKSIVFMKWISKKQTVKSGHLRFYCLSVSYTMPSFLFYIILSSTQRLFYRFRRKIQYTPSCISFQWSAALEILLQCIQLYFLQTSLGVHVTDLGRWFYILYLQNMCWENE